jgi:hypothetical protein
MSDFILGLDLGQASDPSALVLLQVDEVPDESAPPPRDGRPDKRPLVRRYDARHLHRWALGTKYGDVVADVKRLLTDPPQPAAPEGPLVLAGADLIIDQTGVGAAVVEMFEGAGLPATVSPVLITAGHDENFAEGTWRVPKKALVSVVQVLLQSRRLRVGRRHALAEVLGKELNTFKVKVSVQTGHESFEAWRERDHDDLVLAVALACWWGERNTGGGGALPIDLRRRPNDPPPQWRQEGRGLFGRP